MPLVNPFGNQDPTQSSLDLNPIGTAGIRPLRSPLAGAPDAPQVTTAPSNTQGITKLANLSAFSGGGAYNVGKTANELIKSPRDLQESYASRAKIRGGYTGKAVGIDHIIPISLGGQDSLDNIQLLPKQEFDKKTIIDDLSYFLYQKGKISLAQARNLNKNWDNNPAGLLDIAALKADPELAKDIVFPDGRSFNIHQALTQLPKPAGKVTAKDVAKEFVTEGPRLAGNAIFTGLKKGFEAANKYIGGTLFGAAQSLFRGKNFKEETKKYMKASDEGKMPIANPADSATNPFLEAPKGLLTTASFGFLRPDSTTYDNKNEQMLGKFLNLGGKAAGFVFGLKGLETAATKVLPKIPGVTKAFNVVKDTSVGKALASSRYTRNMLKSAGLFSAQGQISVPFASDLETRAEQLKHDLLNAVVFNAAGDIINIKLPAIKGGKFSVSNIAAGTLANAYAGYVTSRMDGSSYEDSVMNAVIFGILHGYGIKENTLALKAEMHAQKASMDKFRELGVKGRLETTAQIDKGVKEARSILAKEVANGSMTHAEAIPMMQDVLVGAKYLNRQNLPIRERIKQDMADMASVFVKSRTEAKKPVLEASKNPNTIDSQTREFMESLQAKPEQQVPLTETPAEVLNKPLTPESLAPIEINPVTQERFMSTGMASQINSLTYKNHQDVQSALAEGKPVEISLVRRPDHYKDPMAVQVVGSINGGTPILLGYVPSERNIVNNQNAKWLDRPDMQFNPAANKNTFAEQMDRLGLHNVRVKVALEAAQQGVYSSQPFMIMTVPKENWVAAAENPLARQQVTPTVNYAGRQEMFDQVPDSIPKALTNRELMQLESFVQNKNADGLIKYMNDYGTVVDLPNQKIITDNIDKLSYLDVYKLLSEAGAERKLNGQGSSVLSAMREGLNDFIKIHGKDELIRLLNSPMSKAAPNEISIAPPPSIPQELPVATPASNFKSVGKVIGTKQDIFINRALQEGKQDILPDDYHAFSDNQQLAGVSKRISNKVVDMIANGTPRNDPSIQALYAFASKNLNRDYIRGAAKRTKSAQEFIDNYIKSAEKLGFEPFDKKDGKFNNDQIQEFKQLWWTSKQSLPKDSLITLSRDGENLVAKETEAPSYEPPSYIMEQLNKAGLEVRGIDSKASGNFEKRGQKKGDAVLEIANALDAQGYLFLGNQNGVPSNAIAVKYTTPEAKAIIERVTKNPEKYLNDPEMIEAGKTIGVDPANLTDKQKFMLGIMKDVFHLDVSAPEFFKRINLLDDRSIKYDVPGQYRIHILPGTKIRDIFERGFLPNVKDTPEFKEFLDKVSQDGAIFQFAEDIDKIRHDLGFKGKSYNLKGTVVHVLPDNSTFVQKGNTVTINDFVRNLFEQELGVKLTPGKDIVSFGENVKIGKKNLSLLPEKNTKYIDINKSDMRFAYKKPKEDPHGTITIQELGLFSKDDNISEQLANIFSHGAKQYADTVKRIVVDGEPITKVLQENYGKELDKSGFGKLKAIFKNQGDRVTLEKAFNEQMIDLFQQTVIRNRNLRSAYVTIAPDMGYMKNGKVQMLAPNEIMMSREMAHELKLKKDENGDIYVLTARYPIPDKLAMSKQKVLIGEDHGINTLGKDDIITNFYDTYINKEGDFDGDAFMVYALIDKARQKQLLEENKPFDGIPEEIANNIEMSRASIGNLIGTSGIETKKYAKYPPTVEGLLKVAIPASNAKQQLGGISNYIRMAKMLVDNQKTFEVNGKVLTPKITPETISQFKQLLQEAVDGTKSPALFNRSEFERNVLYHLFKDSNPNAKELQQISAELYASYMKSIQGGNKDYFNLGDIIADINAFNAVSPQDPQLWHPLQQFYSKLADLKTFTVNDKVKWDSDIAARDEFAKAVPEPTNTPESQDFIAYVNKKREEAQKIVAMGKTGQIDRGEVKPRTKQIQQDVNDYYNARFHNFNKKDLEAISWHLIHDKGTNWYFNAAYEATNNQRGYWVERFDNLFIPEHAQIYYRARDKWLDEHPESERQASMESFPGIASVVQKNPQNAWVPTGPTN